MRVPTLCVRHVALTVVYHVSSHLVLYKSCYIPVRPRDEGSHTVNWAIMWNNMTVQSLFCRAPLKTQLESALMEKKQDSHTYR